MTYRLSDDAVSNVTGERYAAKGTEVRLISKPDEHINTVVVEANGRRFPVSKEKLSEVTLQTK